MSPHLVTVWNPLYTRDVDQHFALLRDWARRYEERHASDEDLYVWWGKVRSPNRQQPMVRADDVRALGQALNGDGAPETHLYVTDYRSLYVGELTAIHEGALPASERDHVPAYYRDGNLTCDFWFRLADLRRLIGDDLPAVAAELTKLRNVHYHDRPVSLYGGMVDLPLVVTRPDGAVLFDPDERDATTGDRLWVEYDAEVGSGIAALERDLRDNLLGDSTWSALEWSARTSVANAERIFRGHRDERGFDFSPVVLGLAKALEIQCNAVLRRAAARLTPPVRTVTADSGRVDLATARGLSLGALARAVGGERDLATALAAQLENGAWFTTQLPPILDALREVRNSAAHGARVSADVATHWRTQILGVGSRGHLVDLAAVKLRRL